MVDVYQTSSPMFHVCIYKPPRLCFTYVHMNLLAYGGGILSRFSPNLSHAQRLLSRYKTHHKSGHAHITH